MHYPMIVNLCIHKSSDPKLIHRHKNELTQGPLELVRFCGKSKQ